MKERAFGWSYVRFKATTNLIRDRARRRNSRRTVDRKSALSLHGRQINPRGVASSVGYIQRSAEGLNKKDLFLHRPPYSSSGRVSLPLHRRRERARSRHQILLLLHILLFHESHPSYILFIPPLLLCVVASVCVCCTRARSRSRNKSNQFGRAIRIRRRNSLSNQLL